MIENIKHEQFCPCGEEFAFPLELVVASNDLFSALHAVGLVAGISFYCPSCSVASPEIGLYDA